MEARADRARARSSSPFNFPLNLAAHKIAPAIAAGCPFVLKPASRTPIGAMIIGEVLAETDLPEGSFSILPCHRDGADLFTIDERLKLLSFTGSPDVGWDLKARAGKKKVVLELGGNAACIVDADQGHRLDDVVERIVFGAFYQSGQSCISVQRILVHESLYDALKEKLVARGDGAEVRRSAQDEDTFIGPMISEGEATRLDGWIEAARAAGASSCAAGSATARCCEATLLETCRHQARCRLRGGLRPGGAARALRRLRRRAGARSNDRMFGLQAGVFTARPARAPCAPGTCSRSAAW